MSNDGQSETSALRAQLREQGERLRMALAAAKLGTWEHVPNSGVVLWDARSKEILGFPPERDLDFRAFADAIHPEDAERVFAGIAKAMDPDGPGQCSLEYRVRRADGEERWVEAHGRCDFEGRVPRRIDGTLLDITERKQAEQAVRDAGRRKDEFLALLGHELRNPLAPIRTALELMGVRYPDMAVKERAVIDRQLSHMTRLVDDLLDLSRVTRGALTLKRELHDVASLVREAVTMVTPLFDAKRHRVEVSVAAGLVISADAVRFTQILANLLTNAAKFTREAGHIGVVAQADAGELVLRVQDDGAGIDASDLARIFDPFVQVSAQEQGHGGLGLGLALVRELTALHGGRVEATSGGPGRGSCFSVRMPLASGVEGRATAPSRTTPTAADGRRILVVDDNQDAAEMLAQLLGALGHSVRIAIDGVSALAVAREFTPEVAVLDLGLPVMDGYELAERLLELAPAQKPRLIALTGYGQAEDRARTRAAGFRAHLVKPIDFDALAASLVD